MLTWGLWYWQKLADRAWNLLHGPLARYVKLRVAHAPGMPGTFSPPPRVGDPDMHHGTSVTYVPWCMPGSLTSGFLWSWWRGKRYRHSRRMHNPQFYVSGKRPMNNQLHPPKWDMIVQSKSIFQCALVKPFMTLGHGVMIIFHSEILPCNYSTHVQIFVELYS